MTKPAITKGNRHCQAKTAKGTACRMAPLRETDFCWAHAPGRAAQRAEARRRGGFNRAVGHGGDIAQVNRSPRTIQEIFSVLDYALAEAMYLDNGVERGKLLLSITAAYKDVIKGGDLEARVAALEAERNAKS